MKRHIMDHPGLANASRRLQEFLRIDRQSGDLLTGLHPAVKALHVRVQSESEARTRHFLRIARERAS